MASEQLESVDERKCSAEWRERGWFETKVESLTRNGLPDRFYAKPGLQFFCEWKRVGRRPEIQQKIRHREMRRNGCIVITCDSAASFWDSVRVLEATEAVSGFLDD